MVLKTVARSRLLRYSYSVIFQLQNGLSQNKLKCNIRTFYTNLSLHTSFNIQDGEDFKERVLLNKTPSIVDFHASWCGPCKLLGPRLETIVAAKDGKVQLAKIDIDDNTDLALEYNVSSVPTVLAVKNGKVVDKFIGLQDDDKIESFVNKLSL